MNTEGAVFVLRAGLLAEMGALAALVLYRLLTGQIATSGLLAAEGHEGASAERILLLAAVIAGASAYAMTALTAAAASNYTATCLPDVPDSLLNVAVGGGQAVFLATKGARMFLDQRRSK